MAIPKWLEQGSTRQRSKKQEKKIAKQFGGKTTINSGATLKQNDVFSEDFDFECKTTGSGSYRFSVEEFRKLEKRTPGNRKPVFVIEFSEFDEDYVVLKKSDFLTLIQ